MPKERDKKYGQHGPRNSARGRIHHQIVDESAIVIKGAYIQSGLGHFSNSRPKFYAEVEKRTGLRLHPGTINIRCEPEAFVTIPEPSLQIEGVDEIDLNEDQYLLIGPCSINGVRGYRILPVVRPNRKAGHDSEGVIEISLVKKLDLRNREELEVIFPDE